MDKIEKLKEINSRIDNILNDLETYIFVKKIDINEERVIKKYVQKVVNSK